MGKKTIQFQIVQDEEAIRLKSTQRKKLKLNHIFNNLKRRNGLLNVKLDNFTGFAVGFIFNQTALKLPINPPHTADTHLTD